MHNDSDAFGRFLEERRKDKGLTMREFATRIGIKAPYLSDIEKGRRAAPDSKLELIARELKLNPEDQATMYDLAAQTRENQAPTDLTGFIMDSPQARVALRRAKERDLNDSQWQAILDVIDGDN